jgi:hypothetical protein
MNYLLPMARNTVTGQTVKTQDLTGGRFQLSQQQQAQNSADRLAESLTQRTREQWQGFVRTYTPRFKNT